MSQIRVDKVFIYFENKDDSNFRKLANCGHAACSDCFATHCRVWITNNCFINPRCPICRQDITISDVIDQWGQVWKDAESYQERRSLQRWEELHFEHCLKCRENCFDRCFTVPCGHNYLFYRNCDTIEEGRSTCGILYEL